jgi:F420-0:gamma-glutamyl ligase-like protein
MRGNLRDLLPSLEIRKRISNSRAYKALTSDTTRIFGVLGAVVVAMALSAAGILSGFGLFLLSMIAMKALYVVGSSLLLSFSVAVFIACYLWLTA